MVTNPQQLIVSPGAPAPRQAPPSTSTAAADEGLLARAMEYVTQALCGFHGHDSVLHFEEKRILLRCTSCGYDSPGWEVSDREPRVKYARPEEERFLLEPLKKTAA
jgi:hypothetical protein